MRERKRRLTLEPLETRRVLTAPTFSGATVTLTSDSDAATFEVVRSYAPDANSIANEPLLEGAITFDLATTTVSDILLVEAGIEETPGANIPGGWYNDTAHGSDTSPPPTQAIAATPQVAFDSWNTTPGSTSSAGAFVSIEGRDLVAYFDVSNDGPQDRFTFARITLIPDSTGVTSAVVHGRIQIGNFPTQQPVRYAPFEYRFDSSQTLSVNQNAPTGATVGYVLATDPDGDEINYSIVGGNDGGAFDIDSATGAIVTNQPASASEYALVIEATANGQSASTTVQIEVSDDNNAPTFPSTQPIEIHEDISTGTVISSISATDIDGDALSYTLTATRDGSSSQVDNFGIDSESGEINIRLPFGSIEMDTDYTLELTATDPAGLTATTTVDVTVTADNDAPRFRDTTFTVGENVAIGGLVRVVPVTDPNRDPLSFEITDGNVDGLFALNESTGEITAAGVLVADTTHSLTVRATDPDGLEAEETLTINVITVDPAPRFSGFGNIRRWIAEDAPTGSSIGPAVTATDPFGDTLSYAIIQSSEPGLFAYEAATNEIILTRAFIPSDTAGVVFGNPNFRLVLQATNSAGLTDTTEVVITQVPELTLEHIEDDPTANHFTPPPWQNSEDRRDVNGDGQVTPIDALLTINELNDGKYHITSNGVLATFAQRPPYYDINGDNLVTAIDALQVINWLNRPATGQTAATYSFAFDPSTVDDDDLETPSPWSENLVDLAFE